MGPDNWNDSANWSPGSVPDNNGTIYEVRIDNGDLGTASIVSLDLSLDILSLTVDAGDRLNIQQAKALTIDDTVGTGFISNAGTVSISGLTSTTQLLIKGDVTLDGGGTVELADSASNFLRGASGTNSLINEDNLIQGAGFLGNNNLQVINRGVVEANGTNKLTLDPPTAGFVNKGTIRAVGGSTLKILNGTVTNTESSVDGTIEAIDSSTVQLSGAIVDGGILRASNGGLIDVIGASTLKNLPASLDADVQVNNGVTLTLVGSIHNIGTIDVNASTASTGLSINDGDVTLTGGGTIILSDDVDNRVTGNNAANRLINEDNTIEGAGNIGNNSIGLLNRSLIDANATATLTVDPSSTGVVNAGTIRATGGGILKLNGGTFTNFEGSTDGLIQANASIVRITSSSVSGGDIAVLGAGTLELSNATVTSGTVANSATGTIKTTSGTSTLGGTVTNPAGGQIRVLNATTLTLQSSGTYQNMGTLSVEAGTSATRLKMSGGAVTLSGGGTVTLGNDSDNKIEGIAATDRLINADNTIEGGGFIGNNTMGLTNQGTITANQPTALVIDPSSSADVINSGTMRATSGATLRLLGGTFTNFEGSTDGLIQANASIVRITSSSVSGGDIAVLGAGTLELSSATMTGGTVANSATGTIKTTSGTSTLGGTVTNPDGGQIRVLNGSTLTLQSSGTYQNMGTLSVEAGTSAAVLKMSGGAVTLSGGGTVTLGNDSDNRIEGIAATDRLINADNTVEGGGFIGNNTMGLTNQGTITANQPTALVIDPSSSADVINTGTLRADGGTLRLSGGSFNNTGGTIEAVNNSTVQLSSVPVEGGTLQTATDGLIDVIGASTLKNLPASLDADVQVNNGVTLTLVGSIHNIGTIDVNASTASTGLSINDGDVTLTGGGMIFFSDSLNNFVTGNSSSNSLINEDNAIEGAGFLGSNIIQLINRGSISATGANALTIDLSSSTTNEGTFAALGSGGLSFADAFTNQASVVVGSGSQFLVTGNFTQTGGFTLADGLVDPTGIFDLVDGGLGGSGTVAANVTSGGLIAPGNSAGTLAVAGDLTMTSTAALAFEIGGLSQGTKYDFLSVSGSASLDGDLEFSFFNGGQNLIGDTDALEVLGATTITGSFFNVASGDRLIAIDGKGSFIVNYGSGSPFNPGSVILSDFILIPEPRVYGMILAVAVSMVVATRRRSVRAGK